MTDREPFGARMFKDAKSTKKDFSRKVRQIPLSFPFCADERGIFGFPGDPSMEFILRTAEGLRTSLAR